MQPQGYQYPTAPPAPAPVDKEIHGILRGVEQRQGGWCRFEILEQGNQYPTKVDTKKPELVQQAMSLMGQPVTAAIREQASTNINPHNGQPYTNRYLNAIAPQGGVPGVVIYGQHGAPNGPAQAAQMAAQPQPQAVPLTQPTQVMQPAQQFEMGLAGAAKDLNIMRQTAAKVVAMSIDAIPEDQRTPAGLVAACEAWIAYFVYGPLRFGVTPFDQPQGTPQAQQHSTPEQAASVAAAAQQPVPQPAQQDGAQPQPQGEIWPCPDCGYTNQHSIGCPRGQYQ